MRLRTPNRIVIHNAAVQAQSCSPTFCSPSTACICRSTVKARSIAREGVDLDVSTLADWVGAAAATLMPLVTRHGAHGTRTDARRADHA